MAELLLVSNPHKRRKHKRKSRKGRKPAGLRKYWAARRAGKTRTKHRRRVKRHSGGRRRPVLGYVVGKKKIRRRKLNPHHMHHRRHRRRHNMYLHNPSLRGMLGQIVPTAKAGAWGAAGALGLDVLWGLVTNQLPSVAGFLTNPYVGFAAKAAGAVTVGALGGKLARGKGRELAVGAMTVVAHDFLKSLLIQMAPTMFGPGGSVPLGAYLSAAGGPDYLGSYLSGSAPIVGTATIPQAYLPFSGSSGNSGTSDGQYMEDVMGLDPWG
jgi:hypothetical protein